VEFHARAYASLLAMWATLSQNVTRKTDQLIVYASRLLNIVEQNYSTTKKEVLAMVFSLHKFKHYLLGNKFFFLCRSYGISLFGQQTTNFKENN